MNRDREHALNPKLDTLTSPDVAAYRSGAWLGPAVPSTKLNPQHGSGIDPNNIAELSARIRVQLERAV